MSVTQEFVTISMEKFKWDSIVAYFELNNPIDYTIKEVKIKDEMFKDDEYDKSLGREIHKLIDKREEYQFNKRNNIKS